MNLAILIGVDSYTRPVSDLPACKHDVDLMSQLLRHTRKWNYTRIIIKQDPDAHLTSADLAHRFEVFLTKVAKEKLGLEDEGQEKPKKVDASKDKKSDVSK